MNTPQLIYEVAGIKYLLFAVPVTGKNKHILNSEVEKFDGIVQGIKQITPAGFLTNAIVVVNVLIPEQQAVRFQKEAKL